MKWIKKYEELKPSTYRSAAHKLDNWNKSKKADVLFDWADEREYGIFNMHIANEAALIFRNVKFTLPALVGVYYGSDINKNLIDIKDSSDLAESLVQKWMSGSENLSISLEFGLKPTKETLKLKDFKFPTQHTFKEHGVSRYLGNIFPTFTIKLLMSEWGDGINTWFQDDVDESFDGSLYSFYETSSLEEVNICRPFTDHYFGIFSDRKSAIKFKKYFLEILDDNAKVDIKEKIMDILSIVGGDSNKIDHIMNKLKNIRIQGLYDDEISYTSALNKRWFGHSDRFGKNIN
jgi:hypothetical protein